MQPSTHLPQIPCTSEHVERALSWNGAQLEKALTAGRYSAGFCSRQWPRSSSKALMSCRSMRNRLPSLCRASLRRRVETDQLQGS